MRRVTCSRSGRRRCAWTWLLQRNVIHDTIKLLTGDAGSGALRLGHCGFGCRCQLCSQETHWLHFSVFVDALHNLEAVTTPSPLPGWAALRGESGCSPRKVCPGRVFLFVFHFIVEPLGGCCCVSIIAGPGVTCKLARHMTAASILRYFRSMPQVVRQAAALGCCAGLLRYVPFLVEGHCGELARHKPRSFFFVRFCWRFLLLLISLLCCLYCVVSR